MLKTSIGHHTISMSLCLSWQGLNEIYKIFKQYEKDTGNIRIRPIGETQTKVMQNETVQETRIGFEIRFNGKDRGVKWILWFHNADSRFQYYGIEAIINPKILTGTEDYITASNEADFDNLRFCYDFLVEEISFRMPKFELYSLKRIDYCINFALNEMGYNCTKNLINLLIKLIRMGDIPYHYNEPYDETAHRRKSPENSFYLKSKSAVI